MDTHNLPQAILRQVFRLPTMHLDATERYPATWAAVLGGAGLGFIWGIAARIWMRLISTEPEFSIPGTTAILVITTVFGACTGLAFAARRRGWRRWGHYIPRGLVVAFFVPFGVGGGLPLMLTVLLATLAITQPAVFSVWVIAVLAILFGTAEDGPWVLAVIVPVAAMALTVWKWITWRWHSRPKLLLVNIWLESIMQAILLLLAAVGFGFVAWGIVNDKAGLFAPVYVLVYLILLYPLFLALRVGLEPIASAGSHEAA